MPNSLEVSLIGQSIAFRSTSNGVQGQWEYHPVCGIVSITSGPGALIGFATRDITTNQRRHRFDKDDMLRVVIEFDGIHQPDMVFSIQDVTNQAGWTNDAVGLAQAIADINTWAANCGAPSGGPGSGATEATLQSVLTAIQLQQDFEMKLVRDTGNGDKIVCELVEYDEQTDTYSYSYKDVGGAAYVPTGPLEYLDAEAVLNLVLAEMQSINGTDGAAHGAGQQGQRVLGTDGTNDQQVKTNGTGELEVQVQNFPTTQAVTLPTGTNSITQSTVIAAGSVTAGAKKVYIKNIGTTDATVLGNPLEPGIDVPFEAEEGKDLPAIAYTASATAILKIVTVV